MNIPEGWSLKVVNPDGEIVGSLCMGGYNLDIEIARTDLVDSIVEIVQDSL